ncbi:hypothetical protein M0R45_007102 [Rubus argutus]|uniref:Uncharacterized protein n=1 Tax=Rubus argutus TaxID=59490 RepID=A0AAW1YSD9_RUBAR
MVVRAGATPASIESELGVDLAVASHLGRHRIGIQDGFSGQRRARGSSLVPFRSWPLSLFFSRVFFLSSFCLVAALVMKDGLTVGLISGLAIVAVDVFEVVR